MLRTFHALNNLSGVIGIFRTHAFLTAWLIRSKRCSIGESAPSPECFKRARQSAGTENAKLIAGAVIAAIRLNREEIKNSPVVHAKISDSLRLAQMIVSKMKQ
ncbi:MAG: hypothetical protein DMG49_01345 [Acidobacteria bacterium]|nr:MAG: hypothetical protein DMG49_01345 [Acidobacteriota bacterium]